jgi:Family of unknown function (DUF6152)
VLQRRPSSRTLPAGAALLGMLLTFPAAAHHSFAAEFRMDTVAEIEGRVTDVSWVNPHVKIHIAASDGQSWEIEGGPVNLLSRMGIEKSMVSVGATIRARGNPGRRNPRAIYVSNILLPNGTELLASPGAQPHWGATNTVGDASNFLVAGNLELPQGSERSFFRIWSPLISGFPRPRGPALLTDEARRLQPRYESEQAVADCEVPGMPFAMMSPYPIEIVREGDRLRIRGEAYDLTRFASLGPPTSEVRPSPLGTSVARIAGDEIVIETTGIDYHSYGDLGPAQSNRSQVVERFKLSADGLMLDYEITITDPVMLTEPWVWGGSFIYREDAEIQPWNCGADRG